jgi:hypothetical protein
MDISRESNLIAKESRKPGDSKDRAFAHLWLYYFQVPDLYARGGKVWNLEFDADGSLALLALAGAAHAPAEATCHTSANFIVTLDRWKIEFCTHEKFLATSKLFDFPYNSTFLGGVMYAAYVGPKAWCIGVVGDRDQYLDIVGCAPTFELCLCLR